MARPLRITEPGLWHHVMNKGIGGQPIYGDDEDRESFLELLANASTRWSVWVCAACLMDTHFHLLVNDEEGNLSQAMRHVAGVYTQWFNRKHSHEGPLLRGRFKSRVVQEETYLFEVVRYIHLNPVRAGLVKRARRYQWSSHRFYLVKKPPAWLRTDLLCDQFDGDHLDGDGDFASWLDHFVHEKVDSAMEKTISSQRWSAILGDQSFVDSMREVVKKEGRLSAEAVTEGCRLSKLTAEEVLDAACEVFDVNRESLVKGVRGTFNVPRLLTLLMCRDHTSTDGQSLAEVFGVKPPTVSVLAMKARHLRHNDHKARAAWKRLAKALARA